MKIFRKLLYTASLMAAPFLFGISVHATSTTLPPNTAHISQKIARNNESGYWYNRARRDAFEFHSEYHPEINWNFRSLGGMPASEHMKVRNDRIFRGRELGQISKYGIKRLHQMHINTDIDLRCVHQQGGIDPKIKGIHYVRYPMITLKQKRALAPEKHRVGESFEYGDPFVTNPQARWSYHQVFNQLLNNKRGAIYYHCIDGRDRTGTVTILILSALGVPKWYIYNDYMATNYYCPKHSYPYEAKQIDLFYDTIRHGYSNMNVYLHRGIGLTNANIRQLKRMYLVKA